MRLFYPQFRSVLIIVSGNDCLFCLCDKVEILIVALFFCLFVQNRKKNTKIDWIFCDSRVDRNSKSRLIFLPLDSYFRISKSFRLWRAILFYFFLFCLFSSSFFFLLSFFSVFLIWIFFSNFIFSFFSHQSQTVEV